MREKEESEHRYSTGQQSISDLYFFFSFLMWGDHKREKQKTQNKTERQQTEWNVRVCGVPICQILLEQCNKSQMMSSSLVLLVINGFFSFCTTDI